MERALANRKYIIIGFIVMVGAIFVVRLFYVQILVDKYILSANNNVLRYMTQYPARGLVFDRNGKLLVYNEAAYDLMVIPRQVKKPDTAALCELIGIDREEFRRRLEKARNFAPYLPTIFEAQITRENYGYLEEKLFRFPFNCVRCANTLILPQPIPSGILVKPVPILSPKIPITGRATMSGSAG